jgi:hypothetical protein
MKVAYIDYKLNVSFTKKLREKGVDLTVSDTLKEFEMKGHLLDDFQVLLFHPGIDYQYEIGRVKKEYPNLALAVVTPPTSQIDYMGSRKRDFPIFSYKDLNKIMKFIKTNQ